MDSISKYAVLVVDDDESIVKNMRRVLRRKGFDRVVSALNAGQAIGLLESSGDDFFLIISDQRMPGIQGSEFLEKTILLSPESRRMLVTGYSDFDAIVNAVNRGAVHQYITKPWDNDDLLLRVMGEFEIFKKSMEKKRLFKIITHQNRKLFHLANKQRRIGRRFKDSIFKKKQKIGELKASIEQAEAADQYKIACSGFDELLSRTITMGKDNLIKAMSLAEAEVRNIIQTIMEKNDIPFEPLARTNNIKFSKEQDDKVYEIIDVIMGKVMEKTEPGLSGIDRQFRPGVVLNDYKEVPGFGTLALNDGYVTMEEFEKAESEPGSGRAGQGEDITIDKIFIKNKYLTRQDVSKIYAKLALIEMRLKDRSLAEKLVQNRMATAMDIDRAFHKQEDIFEKQGIVLPLEGILEEAHVITSRAGGLLEEALNETAVKTEVSGSGTYSREVDPYIDLIISRDRLKAFIRMPEVSTRKYSINFIKKFIKKQGICFGIADDKSLDGFIKNCRDPSERFNIASGKPVNPGRSGEIIYYFNIGDKSAGVVNKDGSIDFTSRGNSPFVKKGRVLAEKKPMVKGEPGIDIYGSTIPCKPVKDSIIICGDNVRLSDDGLKLISTISGQPGIDFRGAVSVQEGFIIKGNVDFRTGNIKFKGDVIIGGTVKQGFKVECRELTAGEINGGIIKTYGDLKVANGIVDAVIESRGNVRAKFVNNSTVYAYGDMMVTREIMGSEIAISGAMDNETGRITGSTIAARMGLNVRQIGTKKAEPSIIKPGTDDHIEWLADKYGEKLVNIQTKLDSLIRLKKSLDTENNAMHFKVANQTFAQEKMIKKINDLKAKVDKTEDSRKSSRLLNRIEELKNAVGNADKKIKAVFDEQDQVLSIMEENQTAVQLLNNELDGLKKEKKESIKLLSGLPEVPILRVNRKICSGTMVKCTRASMVVRENFGRSEFVQIDSDTTGKVKTIIHRSTAG